MAGQLFRNFSALMRGHGKTVQTRALRSECLESVSSAPHLSCMGIVAVSMRMSTG